MDYSSPENDSQAKSELDIILQKTLQFFWSQAQPAPRFQPPLHFSEPNNVASLTPFVLALSGGMDSVVLLDLIAKALWAGELDEAQVCAVYIDHQLQPASAEWGDFCEQLCAEYGINFQHLTVSVEDSRRQGLEKRAREARYQALFAQASKGGLPGVVLTAHHADDQAETILLNLMRGAGVRGLAAMPAVRQTEDGWLLRPLLPITRQQIFAYAQSHKLRWVEDPSNLNTEFRRNWFRQTLIPQLMSEFPKMNTQLVKTAEHLQEADFLLQKMAKQQLDLIHSEAGEKVNQFFVVLPKVITLHSMGCDKVGRDKVLIDSGVHFAELKNILRYWAESYGLPSVSRAFFDWLKVTAYQQGEAGIASLKVPVSGKLSLNAEQSWQLFQGKLYFVPKVQSAHWRLPLFLQRLMEGKDHSGLQLGEGSIVHSNLILHSSATSTATQTQISGSNSTQDSKVVDPASEFSLWLKVATSRSAQPLTSSEVFVVSYGHLKECCKHCANAIHKKRLKQFFQNQQIPPWVRQHWPFLVRAVASATTSNVKFEVVGVLGDRRLLLSTKTEMQTASCHIDWHKLTGVSHLDYFESFYSINFLPPDRSCSR